jgi:hypothetical protein
MGFTTLLLGMAAFFLLKTRLPPKPPGPFFYFGAFKKVTYSCLSISSFVSTDERYPVCENSTANGQTYILSFFSFLSFIGTFGQLAGLGEFAPYLL